jgi:hypothetical protein
MAGMLGFCQADVFHGTIQNCGADFYTPVPNQAATSTKDTAENPYGLFDATADEITGARGVHFALITGSRDFRHGNILDIFNGGFAAEASRPSYSTFPACRMTPPTHRLCQPRLISSSRHSD